MMNNMGAVPWGWKRAMLLLPVALLVLGGDESSSSVVVARPRPWTLGGWHPRRGGSTTGTSSTVASSSASVSNEPTVSTNSSSSSSAVGDETRCLPDTAKPDGDSRAKEQQQQQQQQQQQDQEEHDRLVAWAHPPNDTTKQSSVTKQSSSSSSQNDDDGDGRRQILTRRPMFKTWKESLPGRLRLKGSKTLQKIGWGQYTDIYLVGTAHVSNDSSTDVSMLLHHVRPDCIFVELCDARIPLLYGSSNGGGSGMEGNEEGDDANRRTANATAIPPTASSSKEKPQPQTFWQRVRATHQAQSDGGGGKNSRWQAMSTVLLTSVQEDYAKEMGVELGGEFRCAHDYWRDHRHHHHNHDPILRPNANNNSNNNGLAANENSGMGTKKKIHLVLGDRPVHLTLVRAWESLTWWPKVKVMAGLLWSSWRRPDQEEIRKWLQAVMEEESDLLTQSFAELRQHFPTLYSTIITERDAWLAAKLVQTCRVLETEAAAAASRDDTLSGSQRHHHHSHRRSIVAIVGAGHVPGICEWLTSKNLPSGTTPETVLSQLVGTRQWANDKDVQNHAIPMWIHEVSALE